MKRVLVLLFALLVATATASPANDLDAEANAVSEAPAARENQVGDALADVRAAKLAQDMKKLEASQKEAFLGIQGPSSDKSYKGNGDAIDHKMLKGVKLDYHNNYDTSKARGAPTRTKDMDNEQVQAYAKAKLQDQIVRDAAPVFTNFMHFVFSRYPGIAKVRGKSAALRHQAEAQFYRDNKVSRDWIKDGHSGSRPFWEEMGDPSPAFPDDGTIQYTIPPWERQPFKQEAMVNNEGKYVEAFNPYDPHSWSGAATKKDTDSNGNPTVEPLTAQEAAERESEQGLNVEH